MHNSATINRPEPETNKMKLTLANSSLLFDFLSLKCYVCLSFVIKIRKMTKLRPQAAVACEQALHPARLKACSQAKAAETLGKFVRL